MCNLINGSKNLHKTMNVSEANKPSKLVCEIASNRGMCKDCKYKKEGRMRKTLCQKCKEKNESLYNECKSNECTCLAFRLKKLGCNKGINQYVGKDLLDMNGFILDYLRRIQDDNL